VRASTLKLGQNAGSCARCFIEDAKDVQRWFCNSLDKWKAIKQAINESADIKKTQIIIVEGTRLEPTAFTEMLKIWAEDTPRTVFPNRKIGRLKEGYEASFLVLGSNPIDDFEQIKNIRLRFKQGFLTNIK
jgi:predicted amidohydrolase YtcJ